MPILLKGHLYEYIRRSLPAQTRDLVPQAMPDKQKEDIVYIEDDDQIISNIEEILQAIMNYLRSLSNQTLTDIKAK